LSSGLRAVQGLRLSRFTLRGKLIAAGAIVQALALLALLLASTQLLQRTLQHQARAETEHVVGLLDQALAAPLAQRDYATLQQTVDLVRSESNIQYLVLSDHRGKVVVTAGWPADKPLPARDRAEIDLDRGDATLHLSAPIEAGGQVLGQLDFGLSTERMRESRAQFVRASMGVGVVAMVLSMLALALTAKAVTRRLEQLSAASRRLTQGDWAVQVEATGRDEIGQLARTFNTMASGLRERVDALQSSEANQRASAALAHEERGRLTTLLGAMPMGVVFANDSGQLVYANAAFSRLWSVPEPAPGLTLAQLLPALWAQLVEVGADHKSEGPRSRLLALLDPQAQESTGAGELLLRGGRIVTQRVQPVLQSGQRVGSIWFHEDVTEARQTQERAREAMLDPLTQLTNRRGLLAALQAAMLPLPGANEASEEVSGFCLLFLDLDDFKLANDRAGHAAGDQILVQVADALARLMRRGELVARLGGDEFAVLCPHAGLQEAQAIAQRVVQAVAAMRFASPEGVLRVGCSVGIAQYPVHGSRVEDLLAAADAAMYQTKQRGKNGWAVFDGHAPSPQAAPSPWPTAALPQGGLVLHYQPVVGVHDLQICHQEVLLRLVDENDAGRLVSPAQFLAQAERSGNLRAVDRWVFERVVLELSQSSASVILAANLSLSSLADLGFVSVLEASLRHHDVDPRRLIIEVGDAAAWREPLHLRRPIEALRALGCAVHLDHFGVGLATHGQLKLLNVDAVKLDGACVRRLQHDECERIFVAALIHMAHVLHKTVIATHVEDQATLHLLRDMGVDQIQGFQVARPAAPLAELRPNSHTAARAAQLKLTVHQGALPRTS
jgi:diguanylate cyclase (GGDEF)-like protein